MISKKDLLLRDKEWLADLIVAIQAESAHLMQQFEYLRAKSDMTSNASSGITKDIVDFLKCHESLPHIIICNSIEEADHVRLVLKFAFTWESLIVNSVVDAQEAVTALEDGKYRAIVFTSLASATAGWQATKTVAVSCTALVNEANHDQLQARVKRASRKIPRSPMYIVRAPDNFDTQMVRK